MLLTSASPCKTVQMRKSPLKKDFLGNQYRVSDATDEQRYWAAWIKNSLTNSFSLNMWLYQHLIFEANIWLVTSHQQCSQGLNYKDQSCSIFLSKIWTQELKAPSVSLLLIPHWDLLLALVRDLNKLEN